MSDELGRIVRKAWVAYCIETGNTERPDRIAPWEQMDEWSKEVDRRIGTAVAQHVGTKLRADLAAARAALEAVEWIYDGLWHRCPWCKGYKVREGHAPNCARQVALGLENNPKEAR